VPLEQATDPDTEGWWDVDFKDDYAALAVDTQRDKKKPKAGATPVVKLNPKYERRGPGKISRADE